MVRDIEKIAPPAAEVAAASHARTQARTDERANAGKKTRARACEQIGHMRTYARACTQAGSSCTHTCRSSTHARVQIKHTRTHAHVQIKHARTHARTHACRSGTHACMQFRQTGTQACMHKRMHACRHAHAHSSRRAHTYAHARACTHTRTHRRRGISPRDVTLRSDLALGIRPRRSPSACAEKLLKAERTAEGERLIEKKNGTAEEAYAGGEAVAPEEDGGDARRADDESNADEKQQLANRQIPYAP